MIKIQRHINSDPKVALRKIRALAESHWLFMNKIKNAGDPLDKNSLVERCKSMRDDLANKKFLTDNKLSADDALKAKNLLDILLRGDSHLLRRLVVDSPENLDKLRKQLERVVPPPVL